ncbi:MAG: hypothetical protein QOE70_1006 [Chthoniobacter sp.]|nr:hypothetical protein [Chthoniobacter sp.]
MQPLYWLAGARWETLRECHPTERERVAVIGSTVLIPTTMAFLGMLFYSKSRFASPPWLACVGIALAWSFVILNTDRILLATYRPFQPWYRKFLQVIFRFALAAVVSVAIAFPFCLDQFRPAVRHRYQTEYQQLLGALREEESSVRKQLVAGYRQQREAFDAQLPPLQNAITNPEVYADQKIEEERKRVTEPDFVAPASGATRQVLAQIEAAKETLAKTNASFEERQDLHRRLVEATARESLGQPNEFYPELKKAGDGPRVKDLQLRDKATVAEIRRLEGTVAAQSEALVALDKTLAAARLIDRNTALDGITARREAYVAEAAEKERVRKERLDRLTADIAQLDTDHADARKLHAARYLPRIALYERKMEGVLDPMEETIGLYKVIFLIGPDADEIEKREFQYRWMAGLFPFLVIFGTLFTLDLVPILAKIFSRPGPYDVLVEEMEFIALENLRAFRSEYARQFRPPSAADNEPGYASVAFDGDTGILVRRRPMRN